MKQKKTLLMAIIALLLIILNVNFVYAAEGEVSIDIKPDVTRAKKGQTVTFTVYLNVIRSEIGMDGLQGVLTFSDEFDKNTVEVKDVDGKKAQYVKSTGKFVVDRPITEEDDLIKQGTTAVIMKVSVKIKEEATIGKEATMMISGEGENGKPLVAEAYRGTDHLESRAVGTSPATASITVSEEGGTIVIPQTTPSPKPSTKPSSTVNSPKATTQPTKLPQTGISDNPLPILFGALAVVLISYVVYRRYKEI